MNPHCKKIVDGKECGSRIVATEVVASRRIQVCTGDHRVTEIVCCGDRMICADFTNTCPTCGKDFNWNGTLLAPREEWGWDTGERFS
jgi:hypothetical protein